MGRIDVPSEVDPYLSEPGASEKWKDYLDRAATETGREITRARVRFVADAMGFPVADGEPVLGAMGFPALVDVGIGCGQFLEEWRRRGGDAYGIDVNPHGVRWLQERRLEYPKHAPIGAATLWDVLEHLPDPAVFVGKVQKWIFVTVPVARDLDHWMRSRHLKPLEHRWYWTPKGLIDWFGRLGWVCTSRSLLEVELGRVDVETFAFYRP